jgi:hypothetical protein
MDMNEHKILSKYFSNKGMSSEFHYSIKQSNPLKYRAIFKTEECPIKSYEKYIREARNINNKMEYIFINNTKKKYDFIEELEKHNLIKHKTHKTMMYNNIENAVFRVKEDKDLTKLNLRTIRRWEKIVKYYGEKND